MPRDWKGPFSRRLQVRASERGKRMAARRWQLDRERRAKIAALTAELWPKGIRRRIIVIDNESSVRETTIWQFESVREQHRKQQQILQPI